MELLVWLLIAVLLITYGGALAISLGVVYVVLDITPGWMLIVMFVVWFAYNYRLEVIADRILDESLDNTKGA